MQWIQLSARLKEKKKDRQLKKFEGHAASVAFFLLNFAVMKKIIFIPAFIAVFACSLKTKTEMITATIFERKILPDGKLMLLYFFKSQGELVRDSIVTETNRIISDSLTIKYSLANPAGKEVLLP